MNASQLNTRLQFAEVDAKLSADTRRVMREERESLTAALKSRDSHAIAAAMTESLRVAKMWGVEL